MGREIKIFDTTLRDGEQSPGCSMNLEEKIEVAKQLERMQVDVIEAGFAIASLGDFTSVKRIAQNVKDCTVASLARALPKDIDRAWEAVKQAVQPRIHIFLATSDLHMQYKLKKTKEQVIDQARAMTQYAKKYCSDVEFSAEDASRSNPEFLYQVIQAVIEAGATVVNIPDTVGYTTPKEFYHLIQGIKDNVRNIEKTEISVHCHDDLGLGVANTLSAIQAGANQVECTINGIGERAGNAALEEIVMNLHTRKDIYHVGCRVDTKQLYPASRLISTITGVPVQPNKAIVGANAFAHESGIHQHGVLENKQTYEIMTPESVGLPQNKMILGKHSGRHAFEDRLKVLGYQLNKEQLDASFEEFKKLADRKKTVTDRDIEALIHQKQIHIPQIYQLERFVINSGNTITSTAAVKIKKGTECMEEVATGDGPIDAAFNALDKLVGFRFQLEDYSIQSVTEGKDALGEVIVKTKKEKKTYTGRGVSTDIVEASVKAYINAINKMLNESEMDEGGE